MGRVLLGVVVVTSALYFVCLGAAPYLDPPEGMHVEISREMARSGDWVTPRLNTVRYFDKPPLLYWLSLLPFEVLGYTPAAARFWPAVGAVATAAVTTATGVRLGGARTGLIAGLIVAANVEMFVYGRLTKPDTIFIALIAMAFAAFAWAYLDGRRRHVVACGAALGLAVLAKDVLGALGPLAVMGGCVALTRSGPWRRGPILLGVLVLAGLSLPWYLAVEARNPGFLWYTVVDNHVSNFTRQRAFPDEDVPLGAFAFLAVTAIGFFPWTLALPAALARTVRGPWQTKADRLWMMLAAWAVAVLALFTLSPFKLSHYALPAFSAMALLVAREWSRAIAGDPPTAAARSLLVPPAIAVTSLAVFLWIAVARGLPLTDGATAMADVASRNVRALGRAAPTWGVTDITPIIQVLAVLLSIAAVALAIAAWRRATAIGLGILLAAMVAALPIAGRGMADFARSRALAPLADAVARRAAPDTVVAVEGAVENAGSLLLHLHGPVVVVEGRRSTLAFGATFADAGAVFWTAADLQTAWGEARRCLLVTAAPAEQGALSQVPPDRVHLLAAAGGRALYSNRPD